MSRRTLLVALLVLVACLVGRAATAPSAKAGEASCGSVKNQGIEVQLRITKGSPQCAAVRATAKRYGHPIGNGPRYFCGSRAYECEYSLYPGGWRCGGLFMGSFLCWRGSSDPKDARDEFEGTQTSYRRAMLGADADSHAARRARAR
jgi:hypothetical protein